MEQPRGDRDEAAIERVLGRADREWRRMRVLAEDRAALRDDLRMELVASAADGVPPDRLIDPDELTTFARDLATSAGVRLVSFEYRRLLLAGLVGAAPGVVVAWFLAWRWWLVPLELDLVTRYSLCAVVFVAGVLIAIDRGMRGDPVRERTVTATAVAVPVAGALVVPVTMGFASLVDYNTATPVLMIEATIVASALAAGAVAARRWAVAPMLGHR
ncbi:hypothetical protein ACTMTJ_22550 [Phytohabitans sp. LJ34]|uniref:hypothetical protein n=1 Tax=Phytohabitans sp. LJ34 TaxID=3452217 RepID=UPI003F8C15EC